MNSRLSHPQYRPDIDGLRALAVLSVVAFHAFPGWMSGGFIGVDVFFVISGYLISTIIFENLDRGTFSFSEFYSRRIRRIFPALILVLAATYFLGWFTLLADEYMQLGKHIAGGAGFISNFILWRESGYFDNASDTKPLLHLWSLGVEEQFYIVYPALLWLAWKGRFHLLSVTVCIAIVSLYVNISEAQDNSITAFYSPQTRFWELMCGSVLAWLHLYKKEELSRIIQSVESHLSMIRHRPPREVSSSTVSNGASLTGLWLLLYGALFISGDVTYPGVWAAIPVLGSALIIGLGQQSWINRNVFSSRVAIWFGLISFPLYLWHWIGLSFLRVISGETPGVFARISAIVASILLSWFTYRFVERFFRRNEHHRQKVTALTLFMFVVFVVGLGTKGMEGLPDRDIVQLNIAVSSGFDGGDLGLMSPECGIEEQSTARLFAFCVQDSRGHVRFALLGDSKAGALYPGLVRTSNEQGRWLFIGGTGAHGAPVPMLSTTNARRRHDEALTEIAVKAIAENGAIETVVLVTAIRAIFALNDGTNNGNFSTYDYTYLRSLASVKDYQETFHAINTVVTKLVTSGKKVILVVDNPPLPDPKDCMVRLTQFDYLNNLITKPDAACQVPLRVFNQQIAIYRTLLAQLQNYHPDKVEVFDPTDVYCDIKHAMCGMRRNGRFMYSVTDHISDYAAGLVGLKLNAFLHRNTLPQSE